METLTGSLDKKIAQLESLKKTGAAPNKIEKLEKEIYAITTLGLKLQNQYILDLLEEYTAKLNSIPSDTFKRLKEDGKLGSLEENLTNDLKNIKIQIIRKSDNVVIKTVNLVKDDKVKVLE